MTKSAVLSECRKYRYSLRRVWDDTLPVACFIGLNPSTADESADDATIRKCIGFAKRWNCGGLLMLNLFAWRATKPADMRRESKHGVDVIGCEGNSLVNLAEQLASIDGPAVAAWGKNGGERGHRAIQFLMGRGLSYLRLNGDGSPEHPLYIPYETPLTKFGEASR